MIAYLVFAALQTAATPAPAATAVAPPVPPTASMASATPVKPKLICQDEDTLGTRLGAHKRCMTKEQWKEAYEQDRDAVRAAQNNKGYVHN